MRRPTLVITSSVSLMRALAFIACCALFGACGGGSGYGGGSSGGCDGYGGPCPPTNMGNPTVTLAVPNTTPNRTIALTATPTAPNGVTRVEFLVDATVIGMSTTAPYTVNWDTSTVADGAHNLTARVTDSQNLTATSPAIAVTVANNLTIALTLTPNEEYPLPVSAASAVGELVVNLVTGAITGQFTVTGATITVAHIHDGFAGNAGPILHNFAPHASIANRFDLPAGTILSAAQVDRLLAGALYVNAHSAAYLAGEVRAQIKPPGIQVVFGAMTGAQEVPAVTTTASGVVAVTLDNVARVASAHVNSMGVDDATMGHIHKEAAGINGPVLFDLTRDSVQMGHWSAESRPVSAADIADFNANRWYANLHTPANINGEIRGQLVVTQAPATTLSQLQATIFSPRCASCHGGGSASLPGSMNLSSAAASYAALVGVTSLEVNTLQRVQAGNPVNSYLIHKLEGTQTVGSRMPLGGPFLDQAAIDTVKSWINSGAPNN